MVFVIIMVEIRSKLTLVNFLLEFQQVVVLIKLSQPIPYGSLFRRQSRKCGRLLKCSLGFQRLVIDHFRSEVLMILRNTAGCSSISLSM